MEKRNKSRHRLLLAEDRPWPETEAPHRSTYLQNERSKSIDFYTIAYLPESSDEE
jgi:hypothetical protein